MGGWVVVWRVVFLVGKCEAILFHDWRVQIARPFKAQLNRELIPCAWVVCCLGIWFNEFLTWGSYMDEATTMTQRWLWVLRHYIGHHWGLDP